MVFQLYQNTGFFGKSFKNQHFIWNLVSKLPVPPKKIILETTFRKMHSYKQKCQL